VILGLSAPQKFLLPKYFYDAAGDALFRRIMSSPEYYLTDAEMEILSRQSGDILERVGKDGTAFDIVELGAGDASKSIHLLRSALPRIPGLRYYPIDISPHVIRYLETTLPEKLPGLSVSGIAGEYFPLPGALQRSGRPKLILFLGATIGNMLPEAALALCKELRAYLNGDDCMLIGFDLKKDPQTILNAYNDAAGVTRDFNLNLLHRINRELGGSFDAGKFRHYPVYDPEQGACKSFLVSTERQKVSLDKGRGPHFWFEPYETIYMEISQKYTEKQIGRMALEAGFEQAHLFTDSARRFADVLWRVPV